MLCFAMLRVAKEKVSSISGESPYLLAVPGLEMMV
jgi:hypothetical protein